MAHARARRCRTRAVHRKHSSAVSVYNALARLTPVATRAAPTGPSRARAARGPATPVTADGVRSMESSANGRGYANAKKANSNL
jgi:hypothetical protein